MVLTSCCRCLDLRRGCLAIGIAYVILNILGALLSVTFLALGPLVLVRALLAGGVNPQLVITIIFALRVLLWISLLVCLLMVAVNVLLIRGVQADGTCLVLTWLVAHGLVLVLGSVGGVWQLVAAVGSGTALSICLALLLLVWAAVQWYWYLVVVAHYRAMAAGEVEKMNRVQPAAEVGTVAGSIEA